jgi:hypothetical protein
MSTYEDRALFELGKLYTTGGAIRAFEQAQEMPFSYIVRHQFGNWGELCAADREQNEKALIQGGRIFSVHHLSTGVKIYVITEADRSLTTVLLPCEY